MKETISSIAMNFGNGRAIGVLDGLYVMCDWVEGRGWEASGEPARRGFELDSLNALVKPTESTTVVVTPPSGDE